MCDAKMRELIMLVVAFEWFRGLPPETQEQLLATWGAKRPRPSPISKPALSSLLFLVIQVYLGTKAAEHLVYYVFY